MLKFLERLRRARLKCEPQLQREFELWNHPWWNNVDYYEPIFPGVHIHQPVHLGIYTAVYTSVHVDFLAEQV